MVSNQESATQLAQAADVDESVVWDMAQSCADRLEKWFGGKQAAVEAVNSDPIPMIQIAVQDHMRLQRYLTSKSLTNPDFTQYIYDIIK